MHETTETSIPLPALPTKGDSDKMSCWTAERGGKIAYDPSDQPEMGGYAATFRSWERALGRSHAIDATQRVVGAWPDMKTGDVAFDQRADAFRAALMLGTSEAYQESKAAFSATGLFVTPLGMY
jgi:hypothetical protein